MFDALATLRPPLRTTTRMFASPATANVCVIENVPAFVTIPSLPSTP